MTKKSRSFIALDVLLILGMILPLVAGVVLKILTYLPSDEITITGARIFFTIPLPLGGLPITESQINSALVMIAILSLCFYLTHGIAEKPNTRRQLVAEWMVEKVDALVRDNMGERFMGFAPFIMTVLGLSAFSSLLALLGLFAPTSDLNIVAGWAILVFVLITYYKLKGGLGLYLKGFLEPIPVFTPFNIVGE
ncbi:MAG: F0F1 ATP synthase subunit A, partial [Clostridia bacterium]|nr:F0F1 ATP synthase subunit A [Clostridia bacterium]